MKLSYPAGPNTEDQIERIIACLNDIDENNLASIIDLSEVTVTSPATSIGDLIPDVDNTYDIGSSTKEWKDFYLDGLAYIDGFGEGTDFGDFNITSMGIIYGVDNDVYVDLSTDGYTDIGADTGIRMESDYTYFGDGSEIKLNATNGGGTYVATISALDGISTGSNRGVSLTLIGGDGLATGAGDDGGYLNLFGGDAKGSGDNAGGHIQLMPGAATGSGISGRVIISTRTGTTPADLYMGAVGENCGDFAMLKGAVGSYPKIFFVDSSACQIDLGYDTNLDAAVTINLGFDTSDSIISHGNFTIGDGAVGVDYTFTIDGQDSDCVQTWNEDDSELGFSVGGSNTIVMALNNGHIGVGPDTPEDTLDVEVSEDNLRGLSVENTATDDGAGSWVSLKNSDGNVFQYLIFNSNFSAISRIADKGILTTDSSVGMELLTQANAPIDFVTGGVADANLRVRIDGAGVTYIGDGGTTNYATFAVDGELTLAGTARVIKEVEINAISLAPGASGPNSTILGNYIGLSYSIGDDSVGGLEIPHDWDSSTNLSVKIYWYINEAYATNSGEVQWRIQWSATPTDESEAVDAPTHTGTIDYGDQDIPATVKYLTKTAAGTIAAASLSEGDLIGFTVDRVALDGGNNPTAEPVIVRIEIEYTSNKLGEAT